MKITNKTTSTTFRILGFFSEEAPKKQNLLDEKNNITEYVEDKVAYICLGKKDKYNKEDAKAVVEKIVKLNLRNYLIDPTTFTNKNVTLEEVSKMFVDKNEYFNGEGLYSAKTTKQPKKQTLTLLIDDSKLKKELEKTINIAKLVNNARRWQAMPPNICNSEWLAKEMQDLFKGSPSTKVKIKVLTKKEIEKEKMNLFLSVNKGSAYEPRLVVVEYIGNPNSKEKTAFIGKGITFDSGGYNLKPSAHIQGMKYDMSGAAICASAMKGVIDLAPKANIVAVLPLTDNKISSTAQTPDSIWTAMNGKTVEINNTDAEGRLILADAITYAIRKMKASQIIDVATLTGAILVSLGSTYTGAWATSETSWNEIQKASTQQDEPIWRMPFHNDYLKNIKNSNFADYKNTDLTGKGGSNSAAMFLKEFTEDKDYIHLDIAGTGGSGENPTGIMVKTLIQFALNKEK